MGSINVTLGDKKELTVDSESTFYDIIKLNDPELAKKVLAVDVNGVKKNIYEKPSEGDKIKVIGFDSAEGRDIFFHSTSHVLAQAVQSLFPDTKIAIGPAIDEGFYYDFDTEHTFTPDELKLI